MTRRSLIFDYDTRPLLPPFDLDYLWSRVRFSGKEKDRERARGGGDIKKSRKLYYYRSRVAHHARRASDRRRTCTAANAYVHTHIARVRAQAHPD